MIHRTYLGLFSLLLFVVLGCNSGKVGLTGKVTFSDDDSPVPTGIICFEGSGGKMGRAEIQPDGTYRAGFDSAKDGLPKGTYKVYLTGVAKMEENVPGIPKPISLIDPKYSNPSASGLTFEADGKTSIFNFSVDRKK